jgi:hypothetical protein
MIGFIKRMPTQPFLCCLWLLLVAAIFITAAGPDIKLLDDPKPAAPLIRPAPPPPPASSALDPATLLPPPPAQPAPAHLRPHALAAGQHKMSIIPSFPPAGQIFRAEFKLGAPAGGVSARWQTKPSAWMIYVPGRWQLQGKEEYAFNHPLVRKVRIIQERERLCLEFYYSNRSHRGGQEPEILLADDELRVIISK